MNCSDLSRAHSTVSANSCPRQIAITFIGNYHSMETWGRAAFSEFQNLVFEDLVSIRQLGLIENVPLMPENAIMYINNDLIYDLVYKV